LDETGEIIAACLRMGLIGPDEHPAVTPLTGGISSLIVRVDTARGPICVKRALPKLKVAVEWLAPVERNSAEVAWMRAAAAVAPDFVPRILGEDRIGQSFAMAYLDPTAYPVWKEQLRDGIVDRSVAESVAARLACVHAATARRDDMAQTFANDATFFAIRLEPYFAAAAGVHPDLAPVLGRLIETTAHTKLAVVHGDVSPKNILVGPRGPLLLDAECAWYGDPAFDVAFCLAHLMLKCIWRPAFAAAYLSCFERFAATYLPAVVWEPAPALEERTCRLLAGMLLARVDGKSPVEYLVDHIDRERVRRFARGFLLEPASRLDAMRAAWTVEVRP
jgi:5-methylthioribose kinase